MNDRLVAALAARQARAAARERGLARRSTVKDLTPHVDSRKVVCLKR
jgi:hypothetical protein